MMNFSFTATFRSQNAGDLFPDLMAIAETMGKTPDTIYKLLNQLVSRGFIRIETQQNQKGQMMDTYDLLPVFQKIQLFLQTSKENKLSQTTKMKLNSFTKALKRIRTSTFTH